MNSNIIFRNSPALVSPKGHYSHLAINGGVAYISGQLPMTADGTMLSDHPFDAQVRQVLHNVDECLKAAGSDRQHLLSLTVYVTDMGDWPHFDAVYAEWLGEHRPARAVAAASSLHYGAAVEIQAIAAVRG